MISLARLMPGQGRDSTQTLADFRVLRREAQQVNHRQALALAALFESVAVDPEQGPGTRTIARRDHASPFLFVEGDLDPDAVRNAIDLDRPRVGYAVAEDFEGAYRKGVRTVVLATTRS